MQSSISRCGRIASKFDTQRRILNQARRILRHFARHEPCQFVPHAQGQLETIRNNLGYGARHDAGLGMHCRS